MPSWDNNARKNYSAVIQNNGEKVYQKLLVNTYAKVLDNFQNEQIFFINVRNEWADGCHLEPDLRNGRKFLEATLQIVNLMK